MKGAMGCHGNKKSWFGVVLSFSGLDGFSPEVQTAVAGAKRWLSTWRRMVSMT